MNLRRAALILGGILLGGVCLFSTEYVDAQTQSEGERRQAYRYSPLLRFIVANKIIFGSGIDDVSFLYAYAPSELSEYLHNTSGRERNLGPMILLRPIVGSAYEIFQPEECSVVEWSDSCLRHLNGVDGGLVAAFSALDGVELSGVFVTQTVSSAVAGDTQLSTSCVSCNVQSVQGYADPSLPTN